ncbi:MAG: nuclear transport factor 2 family protein [Bacteroidales bacterium]|jgi:hypothetical protein|nr:nuclear transport factor 2 family protein [Bacteroidales bacterium]
MKEISQNIFRIALLFIVLFLVTRQFKKADENSVVHPKSAVYSKGDAPYSVRNEIIVQLKRFQAGYTSRDPSLLDSFMESLYSRENVLIIGTMPREIYSGYENAARLVGTDWESWGDCVFDCDSAFISSDGNTAWFATRGFVRFDMSGLLVLPLRLTGVMVREGQDWKFRQQQFQFDIDFSFNLLAILVISAWIVISIVLVIIRIIKKARADSQAYSPAEIN